MGKGLRFIAWIFALPFLIIGALWVWRGAIHSAKAALPSSGTAGTNAATPAGASQSAKTNTAAPPSPINQTIQSVTAGVNAATSLISTFGNLISSDSYQPDPTEAMTSSGDSSVPLADVSDLWTA